MGKKTETITFSDCENQNLWIKREEREIRNGHKAAVLWLTGLSGAGKTTIAKNLARKLFENNKSVVILDGDNLRSGICSDLGFTKRDRRENIRRAAECARLFFERGDIVISAFISPFIKDRDFARSLVPEERFIEVYVKCSLDICIKRDTKGLYKKAANGTIDMLTGISSPYEEPVNPEIVLETDKTRAKDCSEMLFALLYKKGFLK